MTEDIWQQNLDSFLKATASEAPTPGGGSVAMVSGALGLGLVLMALNVTAKGKEGPDVSDLISRARALLDEIRQCPQADIEAFGSLMDAYRLPKSTEEERAARRTAIEAATAKATATPLDAAKICVKALELGREAAFSAKPSILSDVEAGALMLRSAGEAVLLNVDINLPALGGGPEAEKYRKQRADLASRLAELGGAVAEILRSRAA